MAKKMCK